MTTTRSPMLVVFGGLPGTGKTTLARALTIRLTGIYLRIDAIEHTLREAGVEVGAIGYSVAHALAIENLRLGCVVIADCVNPVFASRLGWRQTAAQARARFIEIEVVCSDVALHRQRVENRSSDIDGYELPTWNDVVTRRYEPWDRGHLVLDTAASALDDLVERAAAHALGNDG